MSILNKVKPEKEKPSELSEAARLLGKKGSPAAAKARFSKMTPEQRSEFGRRLVSKRWEAKNTQENSSHRF